MLQNLKANRSGFPDLLVIQNGRPRWIEVKAEGDQIRRNQLKQIQRMREAGFDASVLRELIGLSIPIKTTSWSILKRLAVSGNEIE